MLKHLNNIKILSWNIQSSTGSKFNDSDFIKIINSSDIVCLQETRTNNTVSGYRSYSNLRPEQKYGGVSIFVKNELSAGITFIKNTICDVVACKISRSVLNLNLNSDIILINAYVKPSNSTSNSTDNDGYNTLRELDNLINKLRDQGEIILCGDFNSRISNLPDFIEHDYNCNDGFIPLPEDYIPDNLRKRNSQDTKTNNYKRLFLDILTNNSIHILNGRTLGDFKGSYTCIQYGGSSVVDYFIISSGLKKNIKYMDIMPFTIFSDHKPLCIILNVGSMPYSKMGDLSDLYDKAPLRYKFNETVRTGYQHVQTTDDIITVRTQIEHKNYAPNISDTYQLNTDVVNYMYSIADKSLQKTKHPKPNIINKKPWFNHTCRAGKREINKCARIVTQHPDSEYLRKNYYKVRKQYKKLLSSHKTKYFDDLNKNIEQGKILNWKQFKRLKDQKSNNKPQFDSLDMSNFENFFSNLYSNNHTSIPSEQRDTYQQQADNVNHMTTDTNTILDSTITYDEVNRAVLTLKNGKSSSSDMICNEMLKNLNRSGISLLAKLFNQCFDVGCYPWNNSVISPLHKKGDRSNPDNYRAVAVSSTIGKLFSVILLDRFQKFRHQNCPDHVNQLGFTKGAQTYDHVLTLNTIIAKYKKLGKRVYAVFVDLKKAFDSVCREILFYKLAHSGICGKFYNILKHMYSNSTGQIKMSGHVSKLFSIKKGTEQGHPLSPDLFKLFLHDLSPMLE